MPLSGLGQPLTSELRQVGLRVNENIPDVQRKTCYLKRQQKQITVSVATSTLAREVNTGLQAEYEPIWWVDLCHARCSRDESLAGHLCKSSRLCSLAAVFKIVEGHISLCCSLVSASSVYKDRSCLLPAGDCACRSEDLHSPRAEVRDRLPGDRHRSVSQQRGRVCVCQTTNQWVRSRECKCKQRERPLYPCLSLYIRVFARGVQPTSGPSRLLLSISGLGSTHVSCARLQTHLRTTRLGTHTSISGLCPSLFVFLSSPASSLACYLQKFPLLKCCRWRRVYLVTLNKLGRWKDYC